MICTKCKREIGEYSVYCSFCGAQQRSGAPHKRLLLSATDSKIAGVCGGIGEYLGIDSTVVRLIWAALSVVPGGFIGGILAYIFAWVIIPKAAQPAATPADASMEHAAKT
jgi:phage shock protein C